jgi:glycosyltransferase involved in cell wall biosynthesis
VGVQARGYGHALRGGIQAARGRYVIMGDADDSYDFRDVPRFVGELRKGYDLVQGAWIGSERCVRLEPPRWSAPTTG